MRALALLLAAVVLVPAPAGGQVARAPGAGDPGRPCTIVFRGVARGADTTHMTALTTASGARHTYVGGGVDATCEGQGNRLLADSAEHYEDRGELILISRVRYTEPRMTLESDRMIYYTTDERLLATGNVRGKSASGTRFVGPQVEYFRAKPGVRAVASWRAPGRPFVRMSPAENARREESAVRNAVAGTVTGTPGGRARGAAPEAPTVQGDSMDLTADYVIAENDSLVWASGNVVIEREDLRATSDSATLDQGREFARLLRNPVIVGRGERSFTLVGTVVDLWSREQRLERVRADGEARVTSDSLVLTGDTIDLRLADQRISRVHTWGTRAVADSPAQRLEADSLDIHMPGQRLREVRALRRAIAWSTVDTLRIASAERDWIAGDTIVARFDTVAVAGDTTGNPRMREVEARGGARAFYQMAADTVRGAPSINYSRGRAITVAFEEGEVRTVSVLDKASGLFLEPAPADSVARRGTPGADPGRAAGNATRRPPMAEPRR